uniref:Uncharacterized protein n=1 Tax=Leviviridae sp. TaxID=2027243 RepID=A0A514D6U0_9VIRU|nr:MAG: hypothetical protein H4Rhizo45267_000004 [Leviviridae sp.]
MVGISSYHREKPPPFAAWHFWAKDEDYWLYGKTVTPRVDTRAGTITFRF